MSPIVCLQSGPSLSHARVQHTAEVSQLIAELAAAGSAALGVTLDAGVNERLCAYARSGAVPAAAFMQGLQGYAAHSVSAAHPFASCPAVAHFPTAVKEFQWRNGWFYGLSEAALAAGKADPCPTHTAWLKEVGAI